MSTRRTGWSSRMPRRRVAVSESGLQSREDLERLSAAGYSRVPDWRAFHDRPVAGGGDSAADSGRNGPEDLRHHPAGEDARHAVEHGATALGFVFWPKSPRYVAPERAAAIDRARCRRS